MTSPASLEIGSRHSVQYGSQTAIKVQVGKEQGGRLLGGDPVKEFQGADPRLYRVRRQDRFWDLGVEAGFRLLGGRLLGHDGAMQRCRYSQYSQKFAPHVVLPS